MFDVILCAGILYHLDFPDCVLFLRQIAQRSANIILIDSHFAYEHIDVSVMPLAEMKDYTFEARSYRGREVAEHATNVGAAEKHNVHVWASIDNHVSVWLEEKSVIAELGRAGFKLASRSFPSEQYAARHPDRPTLVFIRVQ